MHNLLCDETAEFVYNVMIKQRSQCRL